MHFIKYLAIFALLTIKLTLQDDLTSVPEQNSNELETTESFLFLEEKTELPSQDDDNDSVEEVTERLEETLLEEKADQQTVTEQPTDEELLQESSNSPDNNSNNVETNEESATPSEPLPEEPAVESKEESVEEPVEEAKSSSTTTTKTPINCQSSTTTRKSQPEKKISIFKKGFEAFGSKMNDARNKMKKNFDDFKEKASEFTNRLKEKTVGSHAGKKAKVMKTQVAEKLKGFGSGLRNKFSSFFKKSKNE